MAQFRIVFFGSSKRTAYFAAATLAATVGLVGAACHISDMGWLSCAAATFIMADLAAIEFFNDRKGA